MDKNSTQDTKTIPAEINNKGPKAMTLDFIRQFARIYMPVENMHGVVLN